MQKIISRKRSSISYIVLAAASVFIVIGIFQGDYMDTFRKAIIICLECIGIG